LIKRRLLRLANNRFASYLLSGLERMLGDEPQLRVLTYHRVAEPHAQPHLSPSILSATPGDFLTQMRYIARSYTPVSAQMVLDYFDNGTKLPPRAVLITFDDAYRDFAENAWGVLKALGIPVILFVPTAYPDHPERALWWDKLYHALQQTSKKSVSVQGVTLPLGNSAEKYHAYRQLRAQVKALPHRDAMPFVDTFCEQLRVNSHGDNGVLSWEQLEWLAADGVTLGAHTRTHPLLNRVSEDEAEEEVIGSLEDLRQHVACVLPIVAYPGGAIQSSFVTRLRQAGLRLGFTTERGINRLKTTDPLLLKRINVGRNTSLNVLRAQLLNVTPNIYDTSAGTF
jgi:peptidoglycan/xylan/chitin deacetylase (PgdA/CDA1 family)